MADQTVRIEVNLGARGLRCLMAAAMIFSAVSELASESITLTTYYPAPSGIYAQMITTGDTRLARDGGQVDIGTTLKVNGNIGTNGLLPGSGLPGGWGGGVHTWDVYAEGTVGVGSGGNVQASMDRNGNGNFNGRVIVSGGVKVGQSDCTPGGGTLKWSGGNLWVCDDGGHKRLVSIGPPPPDAPNASCPTGTVGVGFSCSVTANNGATGFSASGLPGGLSISNSGSITGTPTQSGDFPVTLTASNDSDAGGSSITTIKILPVVQCTGAGVPVGCNPFLTCMNTDGSSHPCGAQDGMCQWESLRTGNWAGYPAYGCVHHPGYLEWSCYAPWKKNERPFGPRTCNSSGICAGWVESDAGNWRGNGGPMCNQ